MKKYEYINKKELSEYKEFIKAKGFHDLINLKGNYMEKKKIIFICGVSGSGKDYIAKKLVDNKEYNFNKPKQITTRKKRDENDNDYLFLSKESYLEYYNKGLLFAITQVNGNLYGTPLISVLNENEIKDKDTYNIIIVNKLGYLDAINKLEELNKLDNVIYEYILIRINSSDKVKRLNRDEKFIENESNELDELNPNFIYYNSFNKEIDIKFIINSIKKEFNKNLRL